MLGRDILQTCHRGVRWSWHHWACISWCSPHCQFGLESEALPHVHLEGSLNTRGWLLCAGPGLKLELPDNISLGGGGGSAFCTSVELWKEKWCNWWLVCLSEISSCSPVEYSRAGDERTHCRRKTKSLSGNTHTVKDLGYGICSTPHSRSWFYI